mgnify:CR=1 FL=1
MPKVAIIQPNQSLTFADYFKLNYDTEDVLQYFDYSFQAQSLSLPKSQRNLDRVEDLKQRINESLPHLTLTSEIGRREFLIAPVIMDLIHYTQAKVRVEYSLAVNDQLKGVLDYYIQAQGQLLVIEAKNADLQRGFTQLGVELIAVDKWTDCPQPDLYGAVTIGNIWQFGVLHRESKKITQDLNLYRVPADLEELMRILVALIAGEV